MKLAQGGGRGRPARPKRLDCALAGRFAGELKKGRLPVKSTRFYDGLVPESFLKVNTKNEKIKKVKSQHPPHPSLSNTQHDIFDEARGIPVRVFRCPRDLFLFCRKGNGSGFSTQISGTEPKADFQASNSGVGCKLHGRTPAPAWLPQAEPPVRPSPSTTR